MEGSPSMLLRAARWSPAQPWQGTEEQIPRGIQAFTEVVHGIGAPASISPSSTLVQDRASAQGHAHRPRASCSLSVSQVLLSLCIPGLGAKMLMSCAFPIAPGLKQPLKAEQGGEEEGEPNQWAIKVRRPQLQAPESSS